MNRRIFFLFTVLLYLVHPSVMAQQDHFIMEFVERLENSEKYLAAVAETMPENKYGFKPTPSEMSFAEQLMHIAEGVDWHGQTLIGGRKNREENDKTFVAEGRSKQQLIDQVNKTFDETILVLRKFSPDHLDDSLDFFGKSRTKRQIFFLLMDHISHHRGQMIVYLRLNGIVPPEFIKFQ